MTPQPNATGVCYRSAFGEWICKLSDINMPASSSKEGVGGPR